MTYFDYFDIEDSLLSGNDLRIVEVSDDEFETVTSLDSGHRPSDEGHWRFRVLNLSQFDGPVQVRFRFDTVDDQANGGLGWFVDQLAFRSSKPNEVCHDGFDNDADGASDCDDTDCIGDIACECSAPIDCDDDNVCTVESCGSGTCQHDAVVCDDGVVCTQDFCHPQIGCAATPDASTCDDGVACTQNICDVTLDCIVVADDAACDDGDFCTTGSCDAAAGCMFVSDIDCDDGVACTVDSCQPTGCVHIPTHALCDDGVDCTVDACDAGCTYQAQHAACDDGDICTADTCELTGCVNQALPVCGVGVPYSNSFVCGDDDFSTQILSGEVAFQVDSLPAPGALSPECSLNFNHDLGGYGSPSAASHAVATSPPFNVSGAETLFLSYVDYFEIEDELDQPWDQRIIEVSTDGFVTVTPLPNGHSAETEGTWVEHQFQLLGFVGDKLQVRFRFDTVDDAYNNGAGWFIDDFYLGATLP